MLLLLLLTRFNSAMAFFVFSSAFLTFSYIWVSGATLPLLTLKSFCEFQRLVMSFWEEMRFMD